ncbi:MAG TPA: transglutaminaseTgpA domain-containing protein [Holophaga sp.]|nr:transglutaminaseTgpA domain-containing protein [Holophaga sp.]
MRIARWMDHLPPWLAWFTVLATGIYEPSELAFMALPLLLAAGVEWRRLGLGRWRRPLEILALAVLVVLLWARVGLLPSVLLMLFTLCGIRLALPREPAQRRQILLMGFLIWLTTSVSSFGLEFFFGALAWCMGATLVLLQQSWESSAGAQRAPIPRPPYRRVPLWCAIIFALATLCFLSLPRLSLGLRILPWRVSGGSATAGLSDLLDLGETAPLQPSNQVALRIIPRFAMDETQRARWSEAFALLRGLSLEEVDGPRWKPAMETPMPARPDPWRLGRDPQTREFDIFITPTPMGIIPTPYGGFWMESPPGLPLRPGPGGSLRWIFPPQRSMSLGLRANGRPELFEGPPSPRRRALLLATDPQGEGPAAERWSRRVAPEDAPARVLADRLAQALRTFRYTLDNPSGSAPRPIEDFLERSHAGHCEYFASALALMLRRRGVPARVVNGFRLGAWIPEGNYWLVTDNEAHSWVEYFDDQSATWRVADPTPAGAGARLDRRGLWAALQRWSDALHYRWDRYVVRFSDRDQQGGLGWLQERASRLREAWLAWQSRTANRQMLVALLATLLLALTFIVIIRRPGFMQRPSRRSTDPDPRGRMRGLKPLLRAAAKDAPPIDGETARAWLKRLGDMRPALRPLLNHLADLVDAETYGPASGAKKEARHAAQQAAKAWRASRKPKGSASQKPS